MTNLNFLAPLGARPAFVRVGRLPPFWSDVLVVWARPALAQGRGRNRSSSFWISASDGGRWA